MLLPRKTGSTFHDFEKNVFNVIHNFQKFIEIIFDLKYENIKQRSFGEKIHFLLFSLF